MWAHAVGRGPHHLSSTRRGKIEASYPLLTLEGDVPEVYARTARYPANFLIDRAGRLQPAPSTDQPFEDLEAAVDRLLREASD